MAGIIVNNVAYSWGMVQIASPGLTGTTQANPEILAGVSGIKWNKTREVKPNYGLGGKYANRGFGNFSCSASITMDYNTQVQLRAGRKSLMDIGEFDLIITHSNEFDTENWTTEVITLKGCFFNEDGMEVGQGDTNITKEFDLNVFDIEVSKQ